MGLETNPAGSLHGPQQMRHVQEADSAAPGTCSKAGAGSSHACAGLGFTTPSSKQGGKLVQKPQGMGNTLS